MCGFKEARRDNYLREEPVGTAEVESRVIRLMNGRAAVKGEVTGEIKKGLNICNGINGKNN